MVQLKIRELKYYWIFFIILSIIPWIFRDQFLDYGADSNLIVGAFSLVLTSILIWKLKFKLVSTILLMLLLIFTQIHCF